MKQSQYYIAVISIFIIACNTRNKEDQPYFNPNLSAEKRTELILSEMTLEEKIGQMCQYVGEPPKDDALNSDNEVDYALSLGEKANLIRDGKIGSFLKVPTYKEANELQRLAEESRLKIPLLIATDAIHGHGMYQGPVTIYPTEIGLASSFDTSLARLMAHYTAREMRATGYHWTFSPNIEVVRDARWGRTGESFGEDPYLVTQMGLAMIEGYQGKDFSKPDEVLACAKHFVGGGISNSGLNGGVADVSERTLHEVFFPPFKAAIEQGVFTIMPAHNEVNGIPCHAHTLFLTDLMRGEWNFEGFYVSDWMDIGRLETVHRVVATQKDAAEIAVEAGLDVHMHGPGFYDYVLELVDEGELSEERINESVRKILFSKFQLGLFENRYVDSIAISEIVLNNDHREHALLMARKSVVLLKNEINVLPLSDDIKSVFVSGPNSNNQGLLGDWSRYQPDDNITTIVEGLEQLAPKGTNIDYLPCESYVSYTEKFIYNAAQEAKRCDVAILALGDNSIRFDKSKTLGENVDRAALDLPGNQMKLLKAIVETGTPVVVVLINGSPISSPWMVENVAAIVEAWEPGMFGGQAVAEVLYGEYNPGGRLPISIPYTVGHLRNFYNYKPSEYHRGRFFGSTSEPLFPFGYGLSYTQFEYSNLSVNHEIESGNDVELNFTLENVGKFDGDEIVLVYLNDKVSSVTTPVKKLVAFKRIELKKGTKKDISLIINAEHFGLYNKELKFVYEPGEFELIVGDINASLTLK